MLTGRNTDVRHGGRVFHVQTEDLGPGERILRSQVYAGGEVYAVLEVTYEDLTRADRSDSGVADRLARQHYQLVRDILAGKFDVESTLEEQALREELVALVEESIARASLQGVAEPERAAAAVDDVIDDLAQRLDGAGTERAARARRGLRARWSGPVAAVLLLAVGALLGRWLGASRDVSEFPPPSPTGVAELRPVPSPIPAATEPPVVATTPPAVRAPLAAPPSAPVESAARTVEPESTVVEAGALIDLAAADEPPAPMLRHLPDYPRHALRKHRQGRVALELLIDERGDVDQVRVRDGSGSTELDTVAVQAARTWKYRPAYAGLHPVRVWKPLAVDFSLSDEPSGASVRLVEP